MCSFEERKSVRCPNCKSKKVDQLISPVLGLGLNSSFEYQAKKNYERATQESAAARRAVGGRTPYKQMDDTDGGNRMNFTD